jgi:hypothetical protein
MKIVVELIDPGTHKDLQQLNFEMNWQIHFRLVVEVPSPQFLSKFVFSFRLLRLC